MQLILFLFLILILILILTLILTLKPKSPEQQLERFIARYSPEIGTLARVAIARMRSRLPGAVKLVYDNYNALVIGFGPNERASDAIFSIVLYPRWMSLFFLQGADLPDPDRLLKGSDRVARHEVLEVVEDMDKPAVHEMMTHALERARTPMNGKGAGRMLIKSISAKQRPRRPAK